MQVTIIISKLTKIDEAHNSRSCSQQFGESRNQALIVRVDQLNVEERIQLADEFRNVKRRIAPSGRGTIVEGSPRQLPRVNASKLDLF